MQWKAIYGGARRALAIGPIRDVVRRSYTCAYIDEYQDCVKEQHELILTVAEVLPCRIVGDPLQGIFGFGGQQIVDWPTHVEHNFDVLGELREPWRWQETNAHLGKWTLELRDALCRGDAIDLRASPVDWKRKERERQLAACRNLLENRGSTIVAIDSHAAQCHRWALQLPGFCSDEEMEAKDLFQWARRFDDLTGIQLASAVVKFARGCISGVASELRSAEKALDSGRVPAVRSNTKHRATVTALCSLAEGSAPRHLHAALESIDGLPGCRVYRPEVWREMRRAIRFFVAGQAESVEDAAWRMRDRTRRAGKRLPRAIVSRTLLIKGIEFDHSLILDADSLDQKNFYVAATRASRSVTIFSDHPVLSFTAG